MTKHTLPELPFSADALQPHLSAETFEYHHGKHHKAYVDKLNSLIEGSELERKSLEELVETTSGSLFDNAGQHWNHSFYWQVLEPGGDKEPRGELARAIAGKWGSFESFREQFTDAAVNLFGSGWCWLVARPEGGLDIMQTADAGCPLTEGARPLLTCDVWEHAYYIDYRNERPKYVEQFLQVVNWSFVARRHAG